MDVETATNESIEQELLRSEAVIARARASQMVLLREVDPQAVADGGGVWVVG